MKFADFFWMGSDNVWLAKEQAKADPSVGVCPLSDCVIICRCVPNGEVPNRTWDHQFGYVNYVPWAHILKRSPSVQPEEAATYSLRSGRDHLYIGARPKALTTAFATWEPGGPCGQVTLKDSVPQGNVEVITSMEVPADSRVGLAFPAPYRSGETFIIRCSAVPD